MLGGGTGDTGEWKMGIQGTKSRECRRGKSR